MLVHVIAKASAFASSGPVRQRLVPALVHRRALLAALSTTPVLAAASAMGDPLKSSKIIPDVIDGVAKESIELTVDYGRGHVAKGGVSITPAASAHAPLVKITGGELGALYTLITSDPDPPDPANPAMKEWLHWLVTNISNGNVTTGNELASYRGPSPPVGTHRYVHMLFKQQGPISATDPTHGKRGRFNTRNFAKEHQLGDPVAVAWFNSHK